MSPPGGKNFSGEGGDLFLDKKLGRCRPTQSCRVACCRSWLLAPWHPSQPRQSSAPIAFSTDSFANPSIAHTFQAVVRRCQDRSDSMTSIRAQPRCCPHDHWLVLASHKCIGHTNAHDDARRQYTPTPHSCFSQPLSARLPLTDQV